PRAEATMVYTDLADLVVILHVAFLGFVAFGGFLAWKWPRVMWFHLVALAAAVLSVTVHYDCPLTTWELALRRRAQSGVYRHGFVDHCLTGHLYPTGYDWLVQLIVVVLVIVSYAELARRRGWFRAGEQGGRRSSPQPDASRSPR